MAQLLEDTKLDFKDVLIMPKRSELSSRFEVALDRTFKFKHGTDVEFNGVPLVVANMDHTGTIEMADALKKYRACVALHKFYSLDVLLEYFSRDYRNDYTFYSMGITKEDTEKFEKVMTHCNPLERRPVFVCVDVANGYSRKFVSFVEQLRDRYKEKIVIMAGNVVTPDMTYDLIERGADIVKIGIGPGSVCTTRKITGVGYPQLSAIMECADAAHGAGGLICGDGGVQNAGDLAKAFAGGADFVMCGGIFAGHDECGGEVPERELKPEAISAINNAVEDIGTNPAFDNGRVWYKIVRYAGREFAIKAHRLYKGRAELADSLSSYDFPDEWYFALPKDTTMKFYGMSSQDALDKYYDGKATYRAAEGKTVEVPYKGPVAATMDELLGGVRSACTYVGARTLKNLSKCTTFVKVNRILNDKFGDQ